MSGLTVTVADEIPEPPEPEPEPEEPADPATNIVLDSVNDWYNPSFGGGFIASFRITLTEADISTVGDDRWTFEPNYTGSGTIVGAWVTGFGGSTQQGQLAGDGGYAITSNDSGFRPTLAVGDSFVYSFQVDNAGYDESDFVPIFTNLTEEPDGDAGGALNAPADFVASNLNSWYNNGSGGYNVALEFNLTSDMLLDPTDFGWTIQVDYSGGGEITNGWMNGFPGGVSIDQPSSSMLTFSNQTQGWQPPISVGDTISLSVQINNAPFDSADFTLSFSQ